MSDIKIDLGSGTHPAPGYITIDKDPTFKPKYVVDLETSKLPFSESSVDQVYSCHLLEHIKNLIPLMEDIYRVLKPNGTFIAKVPAIDTPEFAWRDPTHVRFFHKHTFLYFDRGDGLGQIYKWNLDFKSVHIDQNDIAGMKEIRAEMRAVKPARKFNYQ